MATASDTDAGLSPGIEPRNYMPRLVHLHLVLTYHSNFKCIRYEKRNIISFLTGTALLFSMPACTNLDETVYDNVPADSFGYTDSEISVLVGTVYKTLKNYPADGNFIALDMMSGSDAVTPTRKGGDWYDGGQYRIDFTIGFTEVFLLESYHTPFHPNPYRRAWKH